MFEAMSAGDRVLADLRDLQYGPGKKLLIFSQDPTGLGGQISRRLMGLRLALMFSRKVVYSSLAEWPYGQVFEPLHSRIDYERAAAEAVDFAGEGSGSDDIVKLDYWKMTPDLQERALHYFPDYDFDMPDRDLFFDGLLLTFCRPTVEMQAVVDDAVEKFAVADDTLGVHVRRGDKTVETPYVPIDVLNEAIDASCRSHGFRRVFVSSDDESAIRRVRAPKGVPVIFDEREVRHRGANHRLLMRDPLLSDRETKTAVKNIYLLGRCGGIVGQTNAHFATLAAAQICFRRGRLYGQLVDGDYGLKHSAFQRVLYRGKGTVRGAAKMLLPWMTLRGMGPRRG